MSKRQHLQHGLCHAFCTTECPRSRKVPAAICPWWTPRGSRARREQRRWCVSSGCSASPETSPPARSPSSEGKGELCTPLLPADTQKCATCLGSLEESEELQLELETRKQVKRQCQMPCYKVGLNTAFFLSRKAVLCSCQAALVIASCSPSKAVPHLRQGKPCDVPFPEGALDFVPPKFLPLSLQDTYCPGTQPSPGCTCREAAQSPQVSFIWRHGCGRPRLK